MKLFGEKLRSIGGRESLIIGGLLIAACVFLRLSINFSTDLIPKVNGPYYLLQTREVLERGAVAFNDTPLLFWIYALFARLNTILGMDLQTSVVVAVKLLDSIIFALVGIPFFLIFKKILKDSDSGTLKQASLIAFLLFFYPSFLLLSDFQKNSFGLLLFSLLILFIYNFLEGKNRSVYLGLSGLVLLAAGLAHIGALGVSAFFIFAAFIASVFDGAGQAKRRLARNVLLLCSFVSLAVLLSYYSGAQKAYALPALLLEPLKLFANPALVSFLQKKPFAPSVIDMLVSLSIFIFSSISLAVHFKNRKSHCNKTILIASLALSLFLSCPLIGSEYASRFFLMAFVPFSIVLAEALAGIKSRAGARVACSAILMATLAFTPPAIRFSSEPAIPAESASELRSLARYIEHPGQSLIVARHGLEWWSGWFLGTDVSQQYDLDQKTWDDYRSVYFLKQKGFSGQFPDIEIPANSQVIFDGSFYILATSENAPSSYPLKRGLFK